MLTSLSFLSLPSDFCRTFQLGLQRVLRQVLPPTQSVASHASSPAFTSVVDPAPSDTQPKQSKAAPAQCNPPALHVFFDQTLQRLWATIPPQERDAGTSDKDVAELKHRIDTIKALSPLQNDAPHVGELANALQQYSKLLCGDGKTEEALIAIEESTQLFRMLSRTHPGEYGIELMDTLTTHAHILADLGMNEAAVWRSDEALRMRWSTASTALWICSASLAISLLDFSERLERIGMHDMALEKLQQSAGFFQNLKHQYFCWSKEWMAMEVVRCAIMLDNQGQKEDAFAIAKQGLEWTRVVYEADALNNRQEMARALGIYCVVLKRFGREGEALAVLEESVQVHKALHHADPTTPNAQDLSHVLSIYAQDLCAAGRPEDALPVHEQRVQLWKDLNATSGGFDKDLAAALSDYGYVLEVEDMLFPALSALGDSMQLYDALHREEPVRYVQTLLANLVQLARILERVGKAKAALPIIKRARQLCIDLHQTNSTEHIPLYPQVLYIESLLHWDAGRNDIAMSTCKESVQRFRALYQSDPVRFGRALSKVLNAHAEMLKVTGSTGDALAAKLESLAILHIGSRRAAGRRRIWSPRSLLAPVPRPLFQPCRVRVAPC